MDNFKAWNPTRARALIEDRGFRMQHVAKVCGMTYGAFRPVIAGRRRPNIATIVLLAKALGTTVDDLLMVENKKSA